MDGVGDGDVLHFEGIIEVIPPASFAVLRGKPQIHGSDDGGAPPSFPPWGINLGGVHRREGPVVGFLEKQCLSLAHRQHQVSVAWCSGVSTAEVP
jgi:hypothetical protein